MPGIEEIGCALADYGNHIMERDQPFDMFEDAAHTLHPVIASSGQLVQERKAPRIEHSAGAVVAVRSSAGAGGLDPG